MLRPAMYLLPTIGVSTVSTMAEAPAARAAWSSAAVTPRSLRTYTCSHQGAPDAPMSANVDPELVDTATNEPVAAAARATAASPSGCAAFCMAIGAIRIGVATCWPSTLVAVETAETFRSTLGRNRIRSQAATASAAETPSLAPELMYSLTSGDS